MNIKDSDININYIDLAVSINCNLHCKMCGYRDTIVNKEGLKKEDVLRLLKEAKELGLKSIAFSGGEVMLREDIYEIVSYTKKLNIEKIIIVTNGTLINEDSAQKLVEAGATNVVISLEGMEEINDYIRGTGTFKKSIEAIKILNKYSDKIDVGVNTVISKYNYSKLFEFTKFLYEELKVVFISYSPLSTDAMGSMLEKYQEDLLMLPEDIPLVRKEIDKIINYSKERKDNFNPRSYLEKIPDYFIEKKILPKKPCRVPLESLGINTIGNVFPCWGQYEAVGNIVKESLKEILIKEIYLRQCENALLKKCKGCLMSCYPDIYENGDVEGIV